MGNKLNGFMPRMNSKRVACLAAILLMLTTVAMSSVKPGGQAKRGTGTVKVLYGTVKNPEYAKLQKEFKDAKALEGIAADINNTFSLPADLTLTFTECGTVNAFYDPNKQQVSMCYELVEHFAQIFSKHAKNDDELADAVVGATVFVLFHEMGHALVHLLDLPITGKEEDAVDQLSTVILADGTDEGESMALQGALSFYVEDQDKESKVNNLPFWDEHSLSQQRFYNIVCWVYGQNEKKYAHLVTNGVLPEDRAVRCSGEFAKMDKAWMTLLAPYVKEAKSK